MTVDVFMAIVAALLACACAGVVAAAGTRLTMAFGFAFACVFAGLAAISAGQFDGGVAIVAAGLLAGLFVLASSGAIGEMLALALRPTPLALGAAGVFVLTLLLAWPNAPILPAQTKASADAIAFDAPRGGDLMVALVAFVSAGAGVLALTGFGARGLFGPDKDGAP